MASSLPRLRSVTVSTKVSEEEYAQLEKQAEARGVTVSEWCREVLLAERERGEEASPDTILAEVLGVRMLLLNTINRLLRGEGMMPEELRKLIAHVDQEKYRKLAERVEQQKARKKPQRKEASGNGRG
jgi:hypothetical protein